MKTIIARDWRLNDREPSPWWYSGTEALLLRFSSGGCVVGCGAALGSGYDGHDEAVEKEGNRNERPPSLTATSLSRRLLQSSWLSHPSLGHCHARRGRVLIRAFRGAHPSRRNGSRRHPGRKLAGELRIARAVHGAGAPRSSALLANGRARLGGRARLRRIELKGRRRDATPEGTILVLIKELDSVKFVESQIRIARQCSRSANSASV